MKCHDCGRKETDYEHASVMSGWAQIGPTQDDAVCPECLEKRKRLTTLVRSVVTHPAVRRARARRVPIGKHEQRMVPVFCPVCKARARATVHTADLGVVRCLWFQMPPGWWVLFGTHEERSLVEGSARCPKCMEVKP